MVWIPFWFQPCNLFSSQKLGTKPDTLTRQWDIYLKAGNSDYASINHRTTTWYSPPRNWHHPFKLLPYQSQPSMDLSSWMLKGSILTSGLKSKRILFLQNTLTISQTPSGLSILMVYYTTLNASMFWTPAISDSVFSSTHMTIPLQDILVRWRHSTKSA